MTVLTGVILFVTNFLVLSLFSLGLLFVYHRKRDEMDRFVRTQMREERESLEELSGKILKTSELLLKKIDHKERRFNVLLHQLDKRLGSIQVRKVPVLDRSQKTVFRSAPFEIKQPLSAHGSKAPLPFRKDYFSEDSKYKEIYYLADKGVSLVDIARKTGKTKGEIDLVLSLRKATKPI